MKHTAAALAVAVLGVATAAPLQAQMSATAGAAVGFETYSFGKAEVVGVKSISLLAIPFAARIGFGRPLQVDVSGAYASATLERPDGHTTSASGVTDTQLSVTLSTPGRAATISAFAVLPTGRQEQSEEEAELAGALAADLLPFRVSHWGSGGGIGLGSSLVHSLGNIGVGAGVAYMVGREYNLIEDESFAYRPGNQLRLRAGVDGRVGAAGKLTLQLSAQLSSEDQLNGANLYRPGHRYLGMASYAFAAGPRASGVLYGGAMRRAEGVYLLEQNPDLPPETLLLGGGAFRIPVGRIVLQPQADSRLLRRADGTGQGFLLGVGSAVEVPASWASVLPSLKLRLGNLLVREGEESSFVGVDVGLTLRMGGGR
jgi:hypothetical protein